MRSWFGDEEAQRRRMMDEREDWRERGRGDWGWRGVNRAPEWGRGGEWGRGDWWRGPDERDWSRQWGYVEGSHLDPSDVEVRVQNGEFTLQGTVGGRWASRGAPHRLR